MRVEKCKFDNVIGKYFLGGGVANISGKRMKELKIENTLFYDFKYLKSSLFVLDSEQMGNISISGSTFSKIKIQSDQTTDLILAKTTANSSHFIFTNNTFQ